MDVVVCFLYALWLGQAPVVFKVDWRRASCSAARRETSG